jgi:NIPSNAP
MSRRAWILMGLYLLYTVLGYCQTNVYQLRIYKLHAGNEQQFHERFNEQCMPIMRRYGFDILFTSQNGETGHKEFVYLLRWKNRDTQVGLEELH